jgi:hypothetical protein
MIWKCNCIISIKKLNKKHIIVFFILFYYLFEKMEESINIFKISVISDIKLIKLKIKNSLDIHRRVARSKNQCARGTRGVESMAKIVEWAWARVVLVATSKVRSAQLLRFHGSQFPSIRYGKWALCDCA